MPCGPKPKKKKEKENEVEMSKGSFRKEHRRLIKTLKTGSPSKLKREAKRQSKELKKEGR